jgi:hypothetical protein
MWKNGEILICQILEICFKIDNLYVFEELKKNHQKNWELQF